MKAGTREWRKAICLPESVCPEGRGGREGGREGGRAGEAGTRELRKAICLPESVYLEVEEGGREGEERVEEDDVLPRVSVS